LHPEFEFFWQFEMDARYTGHTYHLLERAAQFAKKQPRKYLWERNTQFYMPAVHGEWQDFMQDVNDSMAGRESIWGPVPLRNTTAIGPVPPVKSPADDDFEWGVGEEAELITWLPQFDPRETNWPFRDEVYNFEETDDLPRRSSVVAMSRVSASLLRAMHQDQVSRGLGLASEMSAVSWALYHGLKAVQAPHPIYLTGNWNLEELERRVNPGEPEKKNAGWDSFWSWGQHDDIMHQMSYMFTAPFPEKLYRFWLGYEGDHGVGGPRVSTYRGGAPACMSSSH
jgi:Protein of unknown function (DUF3405)